MSDDPLDALEAEWRAGGSPGAAGAYLVALAARVAGAPTCAGLRLRLGVALEEQGRVDEAIPELQRAKADPATRPEAGYRLGLCFAHRKVWRLAVSELEAVVADARRPLEEQGKAAAYHLGRIYEAAGRSNEAIRCYELIAGRSPHGAGGSAGCLAPLRPDDPPRRPPAPPAAPADP